MISADELERVTRIFARPGHVLLVDDDGNKVEIPAALFQHFARIVRFMSQKQAVVMVPEEEAFTTQAAANYLGVSRQHLVDLLDKGEITFHRVGTHRRIRFRDILAYEKQRDQVRRDALNQLSDEVDDAGLYFSDYSGEDQ